MASSTILMKQLGVQNEKDSTQTTDKPGIFRNYLLLGVFSCSNLAVPRLWGMPSFPLARKQAPLQRRTRSWIGCNAQVSGKLLASISHLLFRCCGFLLADAERLFGATSFPLSPQGCLGPLVRLFRHNVMAQQKTTSLVSLISNRDACLANSG